ncbi:MAG: transglycosylase SLT domain-containing protein [Ignavibacteriales bacterium]|nr:transglycosylase SLT domain-containing protein [Ignavibacteriales bacterium]
MTITEKGKGQIFCSLLTVILLILSSFILFGCSQQVTSATYAQKAGSSIEDITESTLPLQPSPFASMSTAGLNQYIPLVKKYSEEYKVDWILVLAVMKQESRFDHDAVSYKGAYGLMQIMPMTQIEISEKIGVEEALTPRNNIKVGIYHLKSLFAMFRNIPREDRICLTLAAYNAGLGRVQDAQKIASYMGNDPHKWSSIRAALPFLSKKNYTLHSRVWSDGCPPNGYLHSARQTVEYVDNILSCYDRYSLALK